jgi:hypothetical protein
MVTKSLAMYICLLFLSLYHIVEKYLEDASIMIKYLISLDDLNTVLRLKSKYTVHYYLEPDLIFVRWWPSFEL